MSFGSVQFNSTQFEMANLTLSATEANSNVEIENWNTLAIAILFLYTSYSEQRIHALNHCIP